MALRTSANNFGMDSGFEASKKKCLYEDVLFAEREAIAT